MQASTVTLPVPAPTSINLLAFTRSNFIIDTALTSSFVMGTLPTIKITISHI